jgi:ABC-type sugar transport system substrate-binding protein
MMSLMENYATMGAKQLAITPNEYGSFYDFSRKFMEQGIQVVFLNVEPPEEILNTSVYYADELNMGKCMGNMAMHWINTTYPDAGEGELHVGCLLSLAVPMLMRRTQGYQDILKADPRVDITFESSAVMTYDEAMNAAQDGFTVDPDIKLFMCFEIEGGTAVSNYICSLDGVDLSKYAVFAGGDSESARALVEQAATNNGSVLRGIAIEYSETGKLWEYWFNASYKPLFGEVEIPYYLQGRNMTVNSVGYIDP